MNLRGKKIYVTGASGFLGKHLCRELAKEEVVLLTQKVDLRSVEQTNLVFKEMKPDLVFHLAGWNGNISLNRSQPWRIFHDSTLMGLNVLDACRRYKVKKVVSVVASCAYPAEEVSDTGKYYSREVMDERNFLDGPPHDSVACHGYAKRNLQLASTFLRQQYGLMAVCACPTTLYGIGDSYDPDKTKVVGGMVKRLCDAKLANAESVLCWGTGAPLREFLYVEDCAELLIRTMYRYDDSDTPLNLGTGQEMSIKELAEIVAEKVQYTGRIEWDRSKSDGQFRKRLDLTRMRELIPDFEPTPFSVGITRTISDYLYSKLPTEMVAA